MSITAGVICSVVTRCTGRHTHTHTHTVSCLDSTHVPRQPDVTLFDTQNSSGAIGAYTRRYNETDTSQPTADVVGRELCSVCAATVA